MEQRIGWTGAVRRVLLFMPRMAQATFHVHFHAEFLPGILAHRLSHMARAPNQSVSGVGTGKGGFSESTHHHGHVEAPVGARQSRLDNRCFSLSLSSRVAFELAPANVTRNCLVSEEEKKGATPRYQGALYTGPIDRALVSMSF